MAHFGIISPPVSGHIHPMAALGRALIGRGHRVTYLQMGDLEEKIRSEGLDFQVLGESDHPVGSLPESLRALGRLSGFAALRFTIQAVARTSEMICRDAPSAILRQGIDALLVDQMEPAGGAVAEHLGLPFVTVCNALALNREPGIPPPFTPWRYSTGAWAAARNRAGYAVSDWVTRPVTRVVADYRNRWGLRALRSPDESFSRLAQICQMPREFDFPRTALPDTFHYVGPLRGASLRPVPFPWERLDGRPLVYASLGTLQNSRMPLFRLFAQACQGMDVQLVISHGGGLTSEETQALPGDPLVVDYAPQEAVLARASVTLTHAGLNTVLDSLASGVPVVTMPITYEQPAIAQRVERAGAGCSIPLKSASADRIHAALRKVLDESAFSIAARRLADASRRAGGVQNAASIVESVRRAG